MKNQVYSWRLDSELKAELEEAARSNKTTISGLLEVIVSEWLRDQHTDESDSDFQERLHNSAVQCFGAFNGGVPGRSENVRNAVKDRLKQKRRAG